MIDNRIESLKPTTQIKVKGFLKQAHELRLNVAIFESLRTQERQDELYAIGRTTQTDRKPVTWTLKSNHFNGNAVDIVFMVDGQPTRAGDYKLLAKIGRCYGLNTIAKEQCHFEDNKMTIPDIIKKNSETRQISDEFGRRLLENANNRFRSN